MCREVLGEGDEMRHAELVIGHLRVVGVIHLACLQGAERS